MTLDGLSFLGGTNVPTEAVRQTRVITNTYDVARGQFTGGQVATTTRGGTNSAGRFLQLRAARSAPRVRDGSDDADDIRSGLHPASAQRRYRRSDHSRQAVLLRRLSGAPPARSAADDHRRGRAHARTTGHAARLGVALHESRQRIWHPALGAVDSDVTASRTMAPRIVRVDYHVNDDHSLMLRGNWQGSLQEAFRTSAFALAEPWRHSAHRRRRRHARAVVGVRQLPERASRDVFAQVSTRRIRTSSIPKVASP